MESGTKKEETLALEPCGFDAEAKKKLISEGVKRMKNEENLTIQILNKMAYLTESSASAGALETLKKEVSGGPVIESVSDIQKSVDNQVDQIIEVPSEERFVMTKRSKNLYKIKERAQNRMKDNDIYEDVKRKMEELKKIKKIMDETGNKYRCHKQEREQEELSRKKKFIEDLAVKLKCRPEDLKSKEDELYQKHKNHELEMKRLKKADIEKNIEWMKRFLVEFSEDVPRKVEKKVPKRKKIQKEEEIKEISIQDEITPEEISEEPPEELPEEPKKEEEEDVSPSTRVIKSEVEFKKKKIMKKPIRRQTRRPSVRRRSSARKTLAPRKTARSIFFASRKSSGSSLISHHYVEPPTVSLLDPDLLQSFKTWNEIQKDGKLLKKLKSGTEEKEPKTDTSFVAIPSTVYFNDFEPNKKYTKLVKIMNRSGRKVYCKPYKIKHETDINDFMIFEIEPWMSFYAEISKPTIIKVNFSPVENSGRLESDVLFLARKNENEWKKFSFHISCKPVEPIISLNTNLLSYKGTKVWDDEIPIKNLVVTNKGTASCNMIISSLNPPNKPHHEEEMGEEEESKIYRNPFTYSQIIKANLTDKKIFEIEENDLTDKIIKVFPKSTTTIPIGFIKDDVFENIKEKWTLRFFTENFEKEEIVELEGFVEYTPIVVEPVVLDFQVVLINDGVQQNKCYVTNMGNKTLKLFLKIPKELTNHVQVPKGSIIVQRGQTVPIIVRLSLKSTFCLDAEKYLDEDTNVLDFPIFLSSNDPDSIGPPVEIHVMAIVTRSMGLTLKPQVLSLGRVYTHETVVAPFYLLNNTLATHHYGFLNLPKWVMIQPNHGFGVIAPGEILDLELFYSPGVEQMEVPGSTVYRSFILKCTTAERFAGLNNIDSYKETTTDHPRFKLFGTRPEEMENYDLKNEETNFPSNDSKDINEPEKEIKDEIAEIPPLRNATDRLFAIMGVKAIVVDNFCEISAQKVVLPPTPYNSFSITKLYLRCPNRASGSVCYCGRTKNLHDGLCSVKSRFEFFSDHPFLSVEPCKGEIGINEERKIALILRPEPPYQEIEKVARHLKARMEEKRLLDDWFENKRKSKLRPSRKHSRKSSRRSSRKRSVRKVSIKRKSMMKSNLKKRQEEKSRTRKSSKSSEQNEIIPTFSVDPNSVFLTTSDITNAILENLKTFTTKDFRCKIKCLIETERLEHPKHYEELDIQVYGKITKPDFILVYHSFSPQNFEFAPTAIGTKNLLNIEIHNTSGKEIILKHSPFQTRDVFWCPAPQPLCRLGKGKIGKVRKGIFMEPEEAINFPIVYEPVEEKEAIEFIDFYTNKTFIPTRIKGVGITPKYSISPQFTLAKMRPSTFGSTARCGIFIRNECQAELKFNLEVLSIKEGPQSELGRKSILSVNAAQTEQKTMKPKLETPPIATSEISPVDELFALFEESEEKEEIKQRQPSKLKVRNKSVDVRRRTIRIKSSSTVKSDKSKKYKNTTYANGLPNEFKNAMKKFRKISIEREHYFRIDDSVSVPPNEVRNFEIGFRPRPLGGRWSSKSSVFSRRSAVSRIGNRKSSLRRRSNLSGNRTSVRFLSADSEFLFPEEEEDKNYYVAHTRLFLGHLKIKDFYFLGVPYQRTKSRGTLRKKSTRITLRKSLRKTSNRKSK